MPVLPLTRRLVYGYVPVICQQNSLVPFLYAVDLISDSNPAEGDVIDVTALVFADVSGTGSDPDSVLGEYVQLVKQGDGPVDQLQFDVSGGAGQFTTVATLDGDAGVSAVFDDNGVDTSGQVVI